MGSPLPAAAIHEGYRRYQNTTIVRTLASVRTSRALEWCFHAAVLLEQAPPGELVTRQMIADYHGIPESYLAKHLKALVDKGVFVAVSGPNGGYQLARSASEITALDIFEAVEGSRPAFTCTEIRQRGTGAARPEDCKAKCAINLLMIASDRAWRDRLAQTTVADLVRAIPRAAQNRNRKMMTRV